jgi:hypothetical protein
MKKIVSLLFLIPALAGAQGIVVKGGASSDLACVDSVSKGLCVQQPTTPTQAGIEILAGKVTPTAGGTNRVNVGTVTEGGQLNVAPSTLLWDDTFNATAQNTAKYFVFNTTQTVTFSGGYAIINGGSITTINTGASYITWHTFPLFAKSELRVNMSVVRTVAPQTNCTEEMGIGLIPAVTSAPSDGVFFRWNASAELRGVVNYNGTETQTAVITSPSINVNHDYVIVIQTNTVLFLIDDALVGVISLLTDAPGQGQPMMRGETPWFIRQYIGGSAPALANQLKISDVFITLRGVDPQRSWGEDKAGMMHMAYQGQNGGTMGTTAQYANSTNPTAAVPTNTTAALGTGLGGKFLETLTLAAGTDGIIQSFQNPTGSTTQTPRNLVIKGVCVSGVVTTALATNAYTSTMSLAYGHTSVSMATAEGAAAKAPRRIALGAYSVLSVTAAPGTQVSGTPFCARFDGGPVVVSPGEFVAVTANKISAAPSAGVITWSITYDGYFE